MKHLHDWIVLGYLVLTVFGMACSCLWLIINLVSNSESRSIDNIKKLANESQYWYFNFYATRTVKLWRNITLIVFLGWFVASRIFGTELPSMVQKLSQIIESATRL